ncbi:MAG: UDP-3-O-[3-hydroxymyristoyl] N-acetylglucosamine deacetylase [Alphaproteobacteria bacterium]|nr:UDP-3-O-[3-hydroxymyristoyl] N-acetylglucosamine deacetylase [Alphaproteobacteria bacterium]MBU6473106.1 UDP-3-O-[3-hydroxymyristoyl] N-acetylglucosamine deacetylase [Alphaproteobacteria bacterium]MDE2012380.1 UDP-3-O-[3-hydroxymyristoyl] N-acetylglucosamine deacetylase [Alphaproteobacteria bacterium]MDE2073108.1 UDP-3-O-[3-hydroxymyristoyl] N-acetylglucosamine deacetylase [Alphaproteobacteria bacterium]MDE2353189.1 UDP-3-O-[3-hydroxymyristoyl] N-acetylglucosamine deacetylase [Alphaproteobac
MTRRTLASAVTAQGVALHAGTAVRMTLAPAEAGAGIVFRRSDLGRDIPALYDRVADTRLGTVLDDGAGARVGVVEHLMAALAGAEIDDALVTLDGPEPPILDGDAFSYLRLIDTAGLSEMPVPRRGLRVLRPVAVKEDGATACLLPAAALSFDLEIDFASAAIGVQRLVWDFSPEAFRRDIAPARTFGFMRDLDALLKLGLARGASLENTLAIEGDGLVNAGLQRFADEFVRHKILDAVGDLALAGAPLLARFEGRCSGHGLNNALLRALFAEPGNYETVTLA